jgi:leucyl aminopeptidase
MSNDEELCNLLTAAGEATGELVWRLPLYERYDEQLKSIIADIQNTGGREAGALTAASFIKRFAGDTPWAHIDIAGVDWSQKEQYYIPAGPTGFGARLLTEFTLRYYGHHG